MDVGKQNLDASFGDLSAKDIFADMNHIKTGIAIYDKDLNLHFANETIRGYLPTLYASLDAGLSMMQSIAAQIKSASPDIDANTCEQRAAYIYNMIKSSGEMEVNTPSGLRLSSSYDETSCGRFIVTTKDVTDRVRNEKQLARARKDADLANKAKSEFLANMSHEIRTPLSGVFMAAQLLLRQLRGTNQSDLSDLANILVTSAGHLSAIINDVLDLSKIEAGQIDIVMAENSVADMLRTIKQSQDNVADEVGIDLKLILDSKLPEYLLYDSLRVRQCITNLVNNALKFTTSGSVTMAVIFDVDTNAVTIHVVDTGIGIANAEHSQVFDHFAQSKHVTSTSHVGTGLGLAISRKLARLMGGDITLVSELGGGSIFTLTFASEPAISVAEQPAKAA